MLLCRRKRCFYLFVSGSDRSSCSWSSGWLPTPLSPDSNKEGEKKTGRQMIHSNQTSLGVPSEICTYMQVKKRQPC